MTAFAPTPRSAALFEKAFVCAVEGRHRESDDLLAIAHNLRDLEYQLAEIASHVPDDLAELLIKSTLTGFNEEVSPKDFIDENRETLQFYCDHEAALRKLIQLVRHPVVCARTDSKLTESELEEARKQVKDRIEANPSRAAVTDWTITPAGVAVQARGFIEFSTRGGCSILRECPQCRNKYSTKLHKDRRIFWHCPHCNTIKEA